MLLLLCSLDSYGSLHGSSIPADSLLSLEQSPITSIITEIRRNRKVQTSCKELNGPTLTTKAQLLLAHSSLLSFASSNILSTTSQRNWRRVLEITQLSKLVSNVLSVFSIALKKYVTTSTRLASAIWQSLVTISSKLLGTLSCSI